MRLPQSFTGVLSLALIVIAVSGCKLETVAGVSKTLGYSQCVIRPAARTSAAGEAGDQSGPLCRDATFGVVVEAIFSKDVLDGEDTVEMRSDLGPVPVTRQFFDTEKFASEPAYEAIYHSDDFSVSLSFPDGKTASGLGSSLDDAYHAALSNSKCVN